MLYENYEEAIDLSDAGDPLADIIVIVLNGYMISDASLSDNERPRWPFDMHFLFVSMIEVMASHIGHSLRITLPVLPRITVENIPDLTVGIWPTYDFVSMGIASKYLEYIRHFEGEDGKRFDVGFAMHLACMAFRKKVIDGLPARIEYIDQHPYGEEEWLSGFFNNPEQPG